MPVNLQSHSSVVKPEFEFLSLDFVGRTTLYPRELAERLGCSIDKIFDLADEGLLCAVNIASKGSRRRDLRIPIEGWRIFILARLTGPLRTEFLRSLPAPVLAQLRVEIAKIQT